MNGISMSDAELLKYALENGMIDTALVQEKIKMQKRTELLEKHPYEIWEGKNGKWYTYLVDESKNEKRRLIKKSTEAKVHDAVIEWYSNQIFKRTIKDVFDEAKVYAVEKKDRKQSTITVYNNTFAKLIMPFENDYIDDFTEDDVEKIFDSALEVRGKMSQSLYRKLCDILKLIFRYAKKKKYISWRIDDVLESIEIEVYTKTPNFKDESDLVFSEDELKMLNAYWKENPDTKNLALAVIAGTGMRPGEVVAIKTDSVNGAVITARRCEMRYEIDGCLVYEIQDTTKTPEGKRNAVCLPEYQWALDSLVRRTGFDGWLCMDGGQLLNTKNLRDRLYYICNKKLGIPARSTDKLRKTLATYLSEIGADDRDIIAQMGHTKINVTNKHYIKNRRPAEDRLQRFVCLQSQGM